MAKFNIDNLNELLKKAGYQIKKDIIYNYVNKKNKKIFDILIKDKNNNLAVIKIKKDKEINERSIKLFSKSLNGLNIKYGFFIDSEYIIQYDLSKKTYVKYKNNKFPSKRSLLSSINYKKILLGLILILIFFLLSLIIYPHVKEDNITNNDNYNETIPVDEETLKKEKYEECINHISFDELPEDIDTYQKELTTYLKNNYKVSVYYENIEEQVNYSYNEQEIYYAASTIKLLDALYLYDESINNGLDLDKLLTYNTKYIRKETDQTAKLKNNSKVSINTLLDNLLIYSDNTAHNMLLDYIGFNNLKAYGKNLKAEHTLEGNDKFGKINTSDALIYLKKLYSLFSDYPKETKRLYNDLVSSYSNYLKTDEYEAATKYGYYEINFHNIGIVYHNHPYYLVILSHEGNNNYSKVMQDIAKRIEKLHEMYYEQNTKLCYNSVYN